MEWGRLDQAEKAETKPKLTKYRGRYDEMKKKFRVIEDVANKEKLAHEPKTLSNEPRRKILDGTQ